MEVTFSFEDFFNIGSGVLTVAAGLLTVLFLVLKNRAQADVGQAKCKKPNSSVKSATDTVTDTATNTGKTGDTSKRSEGKDETVSESSTDDTKTNPNTKGKGKDPEEIAKIMKGAAGKCPFSQMGGSWPPDQGDFVDTADKSANKDNPVEDPKEFCDHIPSQVKRTQQRVAIQKIEETMDERERENEREIQRQQLEAIFKLMAEEKDKFGLESMDDVQSQMHLYVQ